MEDNSLRVIGYLLQSLKPWEPGGKSVVDKFLKQMMEDYDD